MSLVITVQRLGTLDGAPYGDKIAIFDGSKILFHSPCSSFCNPYKPAGHIPAVNAYGCLSPICCEFAIIREHLKYGKCVLLNGGRDLPSMWPNVNHENMPTMNGIFIHCGSREDWRGSKGCITIPPYAMEDFRASIPDIGRGEFALIDGMVKSV